MIKTTVAMIRVDSSNGVFLLVLSMLGLLSGAGADSGRGTVSSAGSVSGGMSSTLSQAAVSDGVSP